MKKDPGSDKGRRHGGRIPGMPRPKSTRSTFRGGLSFAALAAAAYLGIAG